MVPIQAGKLYTPVASRAKSRTVVKLVQSQSGYNALTCATPTADFHSYKATQLSGIQLTDSTGAEAALEEERIRTPPQNYDDDFLFCSRNVTYDGASSFPRKERA